MPENIAVDLKNLGAHRDLIKEIADRAYQSIVSIPAGIRKDPKEQTGIWVMLKEQGTSNIVKFAIESPSEASNDFCSENAARSAYFFDFSSLNSRDPERFQFGGCITIPITLPDGSTLLLQCSTSGLQEPEDTAVDVMILSGILQCSCLDICHVVETFDGELPEEFKEFDHYLNDLLFQSQQQIS